MGLETVDSSTENCWVLAKDTKKNLLSILCYFIYLATFWLYLVTVYHTIAPNVSS